MLKYNFQKVFEARLITKPVGFLMKIGFNKDAASNIARNRIKFFSTAHLQKLCIALKCTPNDLFEWVPASDSELPPEHPLNSLNRTNSTNLSEIIKNLSLEEINSLTKKL